MEYYFTADEHYGHNNIIKYCHRPFKNVKEMNEYIINQHNSVVKPTSDVCTIHAGDFTLNGKSYADSIIKQLNGQHLFIRGSHDYWLPKSSPMIIERTIHKHFVVICHYAMRTWHRSHYGSLQLYGHSHGNLPPLNNQLDIGVDTNEFKPYSFVDILIKIEGTRL